MLEVGKPCGSAVFVLRWLLRVEGRCHKAAVVLTSVQAVLLRRGGRDTGPLVPSAGAAPQRGTATPTAAEQADGFYKRSSKYLGMPNISAATGIPAHVLFMKRCLNSEGNVLSIKYFSPSSSSR